MQLKPGIYVTQELIEKGYLQIGDGYRAKNSELSMKGIPFARAGNIKGGFLFEDADMFPVKDLVKVGDKKSRPFDSVFTSKGSVGRIAYVKKDTPRFVYSPQLCYWRSLDHDSIRPRFLNYWMNGAEFSNQVDYLKGQTDMADYVSLRDQRKMTITIPDIDIQNQVAKILGDFDDKIELNRRINKILEQMAQAIFKSWFVDFEPVKAKIEARAHGRDPERAAMCAISGKTDDELDQLPPKQFAQLQATASLFPDELMDSEQGLIPKGWRTLSLDRIAHYQNGLALQKFRPENENDFLPVVKIAQLKAGKANCAEKASPKINPACIIDDGDVVFSWSGSLVVVLWCGGKAALNQHLFKVTSEEYPKWFYYYWTKHHLAVFQQIAADKAVTMGHIKRSHLKEAKCVVPDFNLEKISIINDLVNKQIAARLENISLAQLRDTLLPKLLSGEISINKAQTEIREAI